MLYAYSDRVPPRLDLTKHRYVGPCWLEALNDARKQMQAFAGSLAIILLHSLIISFFHCLSVLSKSKTIFLKSVHQNDQICFLTLQMFSMSFYMHHFFICSCIVSFSPAEAHFVAAAVTEFPYRDQ